MKRVLSLLFVCLFMALSCVSSFAYKDSYNVKGLAYTIEPDTMENMSESVYYAVSSAASAYRLKYYDESRDSADFDEKLIEYRAKNSSGFADTLDSLKGKNIGDGYFINKINYLRTGLDYVRDVKREINRCGAVIAVIRVPEGGLNDETNYLRAVNRLEYDYNAPYLTESIDINNPGESFLAVTLVGYDDSEGYYICESGLGTSYGYNGYFKIWSTNPFEYIASIELGNTKTGNVEPVDDSSWDVIAERVRISISESSATAHIYFGKNGHALDCRAIDHDDVIIFPQGGVKFGEDTLITYEARGYGDKYIEFTNIAFKDFGDFESKYVGLNDDGTIWAKNPNIQGAFVKRINLVTDCYDRIVRGELIFDMNTQLIIDSPDVIMYECKDGVSTGNIIDNTDGMSAYYAVVDLGHYFCMDKINVSVNVRLTDNFTFSDEDMLLVGTPVFRPVFSYNLTIFERIGFIIYDFFDAFLSLFTFKI